MKTQRERVEQSYLLRRKALSEQVSASSRIFFSETALDEWNFIQMNSHTSSSIRLTPVQYTMSRMLGGILQEGTQYQSGR